MGRKATANSQRQSKKAEPGK